MNLFSKKNTFLKKDFQIQKEFLYLHRRVGRVVECGGLENHCTVRYRGFESLTLRYKQKEPTTVNVVGFFYVYSFLVMEQKQIQLFGLEIREAGR